MFLTLDQFKISSLSSAVGLNLAGASPASITGSTNASPIVITSSSHGLAYNSRRTGAVVYGVTFVDGSGETKLSPLSRVLVLGNEQVYLADIPLGEAGTTDRKIYRCAVNDQSGDMKLVATISDNTTTDFVDAVPDSALGATAPTSSSASVADPGTAPQTQACPPSLMVHVPAVTIESVAGNTAANGTWNVTVIDADTFSLNGSSGNAAYTSGGTWRQVARSTQFVELTAEGQNVRWRDDGTAPTADVGNLILTTDPPFLFRGNFRAVKFIEATSGAKLNVRCLRQA